jgi:hypothetical protein
MSDLIVSSLVVGGVIAVVNAAMVRHSNSAQGNRIEKLVNGHSERQDQEIRRLHADVARLLKLLPVGNEPPGEAP